MQNQAEDASRIGVIRETRAKEPGLFSAYLQLIPIPQNNLGVVDALSPTDINFWNWYKLCSVRLVKSFTSRDIEGFFKEGLVAQILDEKGQREFALQRLSQRMGRSFENISFPHKNLSLSHTQKSTLFIGHPLTQGLGVDMESLEREISRQVIERVSHPQESFSQNISSHIIWTAKEACFKANINNQGKTLVDIRLVFETESSGLGFFDDLEVPFRSGFFDKFCVTVAKVL